MSLLIANVTPAKLEPYMNPQQARTVAMEFAASQTLARGTVIAQVTATGKATTYSVGTKEVQTVTITGTPTGGTFTLTSTRQGVSTTTPGIAYNATAATVQAALEALANIGVGRVAVTGGPGPGTPWVVTFDIAEDVPQMTTSGASLTGGSSPASAVTTGTAGVGNTDGTQTPLGFLVYDIVVDASGNIVYGPSGSTVDLLRGAEKTAPVYWTGTFLESDLTGLDAAAVRELKGREIGVGAQKAITIG